MLTSRKIPVTVFAAGMALERNPQICSAMKEAPDWEIASQGYRSVSYYNKQGNSAATTAASPSASPSPSPSRDGDSDSTAAAAAARAAAAMVKTEKEHIERSVAIHEKLFGKRPVGFCQVKPTSNTRALVVEDGGFLYDSDSYADGLPYWSMEHGGRPHLIIPSTMSESDAGFENGTFPTNDHFLQHLKDTLDFLLEEGRAGSPKMMTVVLHPRIIGRPGRAAALQEFLEYVRHSSEIWITTREAVANHWYKYQFPKGLGTQCSAEQAKAAIVGEEPAQEPEPSWFGSMFSLTGDTSSPTAVATAESHENIEKNRVLKAMESLKELQMDESEGREKPANEEQEEEEIQDPHMFPKSSYTIKSYRDLETKTHETKRGSQTSNITSAKERANAILEETASPVPARDLLPGQVSAPPPTLAPAPIPAHVPAVSDPTTAPPPSSEPVTLQTSRPVSDSTTTPSENGSPNTYSKSSPPHQSKTDVMESTILSSSHSRHRTSRPPPKGSSRSAKKSAAKLRALSLVNGADPAAAQPRVQPSITSKYERSQEEPVQENPEPQLVPSVNYGGRKTRNKDRAMGLVSGNGIPKSSVAHSSAVPPTHLMAKPAGRLPLSSLRSSQSSSSRRIKAPHNHSNGSHQPPAPPSQSSVSKGHNNDFMPSKPAPSSSSTTASNSARSRAKDRAMALMMDAGDAFTDSKYRRKRR